MPSDRCPNTDLLVCMKGYEKMMMRSYDIQIEQKNGTYMCRTRHAVGIVQAIENLFDESSEMIHSTRYATFSWKDGKSVGVSREQGSGEIVP